MKRSITIFVAAFLSIPAVVLIIIACTFLSAFIYNQRIENFKTNVTNLDYYIESTYKDQMVRIENVINNPTVISFINNQDNTDLRNQAIALIFNTLSIEDNALEIGVVDLDGNIILKSNNSIIEPNQKDTLVFQEVTKSQETYTTMRFAGNIPLLKIGVPIKENGVMKAIYIRYTPLNYINYFARNLNQDEESIYILSNDQSGVVFDSDGQNVLVNMENLEETPYSSGITELSAILKDPNNMEGSANFTINNDSIIGYYQVIPDLNWICMITQPRAIVLYDLNLFQLVCLLITAIFVVAINILARRFLGNYISKIEGISKTINNFLSGNEEERCDVDKPEVLENLSDSVNDSFAKIIELQRTNKEVSGQLETLLTVDPITKLRNNKALYQEIDANFGKSPNQLLIMFNTGVYDQLNDSFGNSVTNRLLEIIASIISKIGDEHFYAARLAKDSFCIFIDNFDDVTDINEVLNEIRLKLSAINRVDDLEINLYPNIVAVFRDDHLLGRSDWLRLATEVLEESQTEKGSFTIFDFTSVNEIIHEDPQFMDNILLKNNNALEGFSRSTKNDGENKA